VPVSQAAPGQGYWLKFISNNSKIYEGGNLLFVNTTLNYKWNMVGSISVPVNLSTIKTEPAGIISSDFWGFNGNYYPATSLEPGRAYWVKSNQSGRLILGTVPANQIQASSTAGMSSLTVTDSSKKKMSLYVGNSTKPDLPPKYSGTFDVRYVGDKYIAAYPLVSSATYGISISSATYPLNIAWNMDSNHTYILYYTINGTALSRALYGAGNFTITNSAMQNVKLRVSNILYSVY
jgi:hypothetical protein